MPFFAAVLFMFFVCASATGHTLASDKADAYLRDALAREGVPGAAWAIIESGRVTRLGAMGVTGDGGQVTPDTPFRIGSLTKSFTALAIMRLVEDGRLSLD